MTHREWLRDNLMRFHGLTQAEAAIVMVRVMANQHADGVRGDADKRPDETSGGKLALTLAIQEELPKWIEEQSENHPARARLKALRGG